MGLGCGLLCNLACALALAGCTRNPYVIGEQYVDACKTSLARAIACASFEARDVAAAWTEATILDAGALERTTERAHTGRGALRATSEGAGSVAVVAAEFPPVRSGTLYLRASLYVPSDVATETINIFFVGSTPAPDPFTGIDVNLEDGALQIFSPQLDPARRTGERAIPRDRWFCFRMTLDVSDDAGAIELFIGEESALRVEAIDTLPPEGVRLLRAGVDWSSAQTSRFEIYMDDIALDDEPLPCP